MKKDTLLGHAGRDPARQHGIVNPPVYHASTVTFPTVAALEAASKAPLEGTYYGRYGTPTQFAFEDAVAQLEGASHAFAVPSGMAAIAAALTGLLQAGDHVLVTDSVYFPTRKLCDGRLKGWGIETTYYDPMIGAGIADLIRANTKVVFTEAPGSLTFEVQDIPAIAAAARAAGVLVVMDNTWSAGLYCQPFDHGVDISVQAATKYIVGHSDAMLGTVAVRDAALYERLKLAATGLGFHAAPDDCYL
ncbi:MAG: PLP-dependent transferase, partial [Rhodobacterales bacterium]|nr:PLP-dependent transferase [Rhodobacterales bacterium]